MGDKQIMTMNAILLEQGIVVVVVVVVHIVVVVLVGLVHQFLYHVWWSARGANLPFVFLHTVLLTSFSIICCDQYSLICNDEKQKTLWDGSKQKTCHFNNKIFYGVKLVVHSTFDTGNEFHSVIYHSRGDWRFESNILIVCIA